MGGETSNSHFQQYVLPSLRLGATTTATIEQRCYMGDRVFDPAMTPPYTKTIIVRPAETCNLPNRLVSYYHTVCAAKHGTQTSPVVP